MIETTAIIQELYRLFDIFNEKYFDNSLSKIFITLQQGRKKNKQVYGTFFPESWAKKEGEEFDEALGTDKPIISEDRWHEIAISGEYLARPTANWVGTLIHEMVHLYCQINDIEDTSNNGVYHNKRFKNEAEKRGLIIEKADTIGYSVTTPSADLIEFIKECNINEELFTYFRDTKFNLSTTAIKKRYCCPLCGVQVQAKKDKNIICGDCVKRMDYVDVTDKYNPEIIEDYNNGLAMEEGWISELENG